MCFINIASYSQGVKATKFKLYGETPNIQYLWPVFIILQQSNQKEGLTKPPTIREK